MPDTYDVIICGAGSGGGFLAGEIASNCSLLILDAGPHVGGEPRPGYGSDARRRYSTQINLGQYIPDGVSAVNSGRTFFAYPIFQDESNPASSAVQREAKVVGGGSFINVGAWVRPRRVDWDGFVEATSIMGWTKESFEPYFQYAERISNAHRNRRTEWNAASLRYEQAAKSLGIPIFETASNRKNCIFCGHRLDAGMPCKYDALMSTALTQIPKALAAGAKLEDNTTVLRVEIENRRATGVTYRRANGEVVTAKASKLVVAAAGAIGTPLVLIDSGVLDLNPNVGRHLTAHPGIAMDALIPGTDWGSDRGYQWNCMHYVMDENGDPLDVLVHAAAGFPAATPWVAAQFGFYGKPYKDLMRRFRERAGAFLFALKPAVEGRVIGNVGAGAILYPIASRDGILEPKLMSDFLAGVRQVGEIFNEMGAITAFPNPNQPEEQLKQQATLLVTTAGALHPQSTCRAGSGPENSVVDTNCMSHDIENLMVCDASVIPHQISANPNAMIMSIAARAGEFVNREILHATSTFGTGRRQIRREREARRL